MIQAIVTDIEGTTSSLSFVKDELFPYARRKLAEFVRSRRNDPGIVRILEETSHQAGEPLDEESAIALLLHWSDEDRKYTPLKALQGLIWEAGYQEGALRGHIYEDAARKLRVWHAAGIRLYVYSSGSVHAQKLLFGHSDHGDLTPLFSGYFDTRTGAKQEEESYRRIATEIDLPAENILFLSDILGELDAARAAGLKTRWLTRDGEPALQTGHPIALSFDQVVLDDC
jgi:enolase-phosphatase E1